ncbi:alkaline phosphatase family protein [Dankookia rubra]|uniref:Alkaline phosphatase family protein n=1 Tax=Dankookia rubra TaxID=1442381 RepID=A0A4R5Q7T5_9PROT|nr:nucleotide pyrophosphatase/phosphodiesterase family protein [Dankookia rubra]TDH58980.1 alkaline phosphatase family protein [Dankookia rubra]
MQPVLVLLAVALTPRLIGAHTPNLAALAQQGGVRPLDTVLPAVTCTVQSSLLTGLPPRDHGIVANGWYFRDQAEVHLWRQSNRLVAGEKIWEQGRRRDPAFTCANMFWWYNLYSTADFGATPRPMYPADGRKIPDHYAEPPELHDELDAQLGPFPLFRFWGPAADISSSRWIARATAQVMRTRQPTLTLCYLPHLDYGLQMHGPDPADPRVAAELRALDTVCGELLQTAREEGRRVVVVSEYGIVPVRKAVHVNRALRAAGLLRFRLEMGRELLDAGASRAFALADHQLAHVYVRDEADLPLARRTLEQLDGVAAVLDRGGQAGIGLDHPRSGELVALAAPDRWFSYYWWDDDARAPDFARTVDIHRKPGYDPMELFLDPALPAPKLRIAMQLLKRRLGQRALLDVTPIRGTAMVRGSHGLRVADPADGPLVISDRPDLLPAEGTAVAATAFKDLVLAHVFGG